MHTCHDDVSFVRRCSAPLYISKRRLIQCNTRHSGIFCASNITPTGIFGLLTGQIKVLKKKVTATSTTTTTTTTILVQGRGTWMEVESKTVAKSGCVTRVVTIYSFSIYSFTFCYRVCFTHPNLSSPSIHPSPYPALPHLTLPCLALPCLA